MRFGAGAHRYEVRIVEVCTDADGTEHPEKLGCIDADERLIQIRQSRHEDVLLEVLSHEIIHMWEAHYNLDSEPGEPRANAFQTALAQAFMDFSTGGGMDWLKREAAKVRYVEPMQSDEVAEPCVTEDDDLRYVPDEDGRAMQSRGDRHRNERRCECPQCQRSINGNKIRISEPFYDFDAPGHFTRCEFDCEDCFITIKFKAPWPFDPEEPIDMELDEFEVVSMGRGTVVAA